MAATNKKKAGLFAAYLLFLLLAVRITWNVGYNTGKQDQRALSECQSLTSSYIDALFRARNEVMDGGGEEYKMVVIVAESLRQEIASFDLSRISDEGTLREIKRVEAFHEQIITKLNFVRDQGGVMTGGDVNMKALDALREAEALMNGITSIIGRVNIAEHRAVE